MLFIHTGLVNVKRRQRLDDVAVYNYKYNIELELVDELRDISPITCLTWNAMVKSMKKELMNRKELMHILEMLDLKKTTNLQKISIHNTIKLIEKWFDKVDLQHMNFIIKTRIFCLAFWRNGLFWYLYNPFRCNEFGFWDDYGYNCIVKFCSRDSLKRHLIILLLRTFICKGNIEMKINDDFSQYVGNKNDIDASKPKSFYNNKEFIEGIKALELRHENDVFTIQIFKMNFYCCKIYNIKLCQNKFFQFKMQIMTKKRLNEGCNIEFEDLCLTKKEKVNLFKNIEKLDWLKTMPTSWLKFSKNEKKKLNKKFMWHEYYIEQKEYLFSLQAHVHITDEIFPQKNRGKQFYACYVICAGMMKLIAPEYWTPQILTAILFFGDM